MTDPYLDLFSGRFAKAAVVAAPGGTPPPPPAPPMDPAMMGGGMPPMDPSMMTAQASFSQDDEDQEKFASMIKSITDLLR